MKVASTTSLCHCCRSRYCRNDWTLQLTAAGAASGIILLLLALGSKQSTPSKTMMLATNGTAFSALTTSGINPCGSEWCRMTQEMRWRDLDLDTRVELMEEGWRRSHWEELGGQLRWYYLCEWDDLSHSFQQGMMKLGWTPERWSWKIGENTTNCAFERPLVEMRPWSRMTAEERQAAGSIGFDEYSWFTKEFSMTAWQPEDGPDAKVHELPRKRATLLPDNGYTPLKLTLNIPELAKVSWESLENSTETVFMEDPEKSGYMGNDEDAPQISMTMQEFVRGIKDGKPYYIKLEDDEQELIEKILGDSVTPADVLADHLIGTSLGDRARLGPEYPDEECEQLVQLYVGAKSSSTNMHVDMLSFNFLYVAAGRKRIRLLPNDQRYAKEFEWGYEARYSVWSGYNLLHADPIPEHGVEIILEAGQGLAIPYLTWHAVENLEPTIAFGLIRDFPYLHSKKTWCSTRDDGLKPQIYVKHEYVRNDAQPDLQEQTAPRVIKKYRKTADGRPFEEHHIYHRASEPIVRRYWSSEEF